MSANDIVENYFEHSYDNDEALIFPIDYTKTELSERAGKDRRIFEDKLLKTHAFREALQRLLVSEKANDTIMEDKCPTPLETGLFLSELAGLLGQGSQYRAVFESGTDINEKEKFIKQFFQNLCDSVSSGDDTLEKEFYRRILMADPDFTEFILADLWESQLSRRIEKLKECAKRAPTDMQMRGLLNCFRALDYVTFQFAYNERPESPTESTSASKPWESLREILEGLLSVRNKMKTTSGSSKNIHATYRIKNVAVGDIAMKEAFERLRRQQGMKDLLAQTRDAYWQNALGELETTSFEKTYLSMQRYLDDSVVVASMDDESKLREVIAVQCAEECRRYIARLFQMQIPHGSTQQPENQYLSQFIAGAISGGLEGRISIFNETAVLIQAATEVNQKIGGMVQQIGMQSIVDIDNKWNDCHASCLREQVPCFKEYFKRAWAFFESRGLLASKGSDPFSELDTSAREFAKMYSRAVTFLGLQDNSNFLYTDEETKNSLELCGKNVDFSDVVSLYHFFTYCQLPILRRILLIILHQISRDVEGEMLAALPKFITTRRTKNEVE